MLPDHAPEARQEVASVDDQFSVDEPPLATDAGFADSDTAGAGGGVVVAATVAEVLALPPEPVHVREKMLLAVSGPTDWLPDVPMLPDQAPEATQELASVDDQVRVEEPPLATEVGFADSVAVGAGGGGGVPVTVTLVEALALPPGPVQVREKAPEPVKGLLDSLPESGLLPDQAPVAAQELASPEDQLSVADSPLATEVGFADSVTMGAAGGVLVTVTLVEALAPPPEPVQVSEKTLELVNGPLDSLPESGLLPDQAPVATQELASLDDQLSVEAPPLATEPGLADSVTVGISSTVTLVEALELPPGPVQVRE